jgi:sugar phosphate isomerase/epimerase
MIRFAAMSLLWGNPSGDQFIPWLDEVRDAGYDGVAGFSDWGWAEYLDDPHAFRTLLDDNGLGLASVDLFIPSTPAHCHQVCRFMAEVGGQHLVCLGWNGKTDEDFSGLAEHLNQIGEIALQYGVHTSYHHHTGNTGETREDIDRLLADTDPAKVFVMCDTGHATKDFINQPIDLRAIDFLKTYWSRLDFIEFKDWHPETDLNTPLGEGFCQFDGILALLKDRDYSGWITVEQNGHEGLSRGRSPGECARLSRQFLRERFAL